MYKVELYKAYRYLGTKGRGNAMKKNSEPLYVCIARNLSSSIEDGQFKRGDKLPTELQLTKQFHVSRVTVRQAIQILAEKGYIKKVQGSGSHVIYSPSRFQLDRSAQIQSYSEELKQFGQTPQYSVLIYELVNTPTVICNKLELLSGDIRSYYYERVVSNENGPFVFERGYMPFQYFPSLTVQHLESSKTDYIEHVAHITVDHSHQVLRAVMSDGRAMKLLNLKESKPLMEDEHITFSTEGKAVFYTSSLFDTDIYQANFVKFRHSLG